MNRDQLQERYIQWDLNQMTVEDLKQFFIDTQNRELGDLDDEELVEEVEQYAPELVV
jgi:oxalate decarboxylase/phosphoglucose isomerase-like protein (cupin superfamily)